MSKQKMTQGGIAFGPPETVSAQQHLLTVKLLNAYRERTRVAEAQAEAFKNALLESTSRQFGVLHTLDCPVVYFGDDTCSDDCIRIRKLLEP